MPVAKKAEAVKKEIVKAAVKKEAVKAVASKAAAAKKAPAAKAAPKAAEKKLLNKVIIQSPLGGIITPEEVLKKVGNVDEVYVRVDQNKAYWVRGKEAGSVDLW